MCWLCGGISFVANNHFFNTFLYWSITKSRLKNVLAGRTILCLHFFLLFSRQSFFTKGDLSKSSHITLASDSWAPAPEVFLSLILFYLCFISYHLFLSLICVSFWKDLVVSNLTLLRGGLYISSEMVFWWFNEAARVLWKKGAGFLGVNGLKSRFLFW